MAEQNTSTAEKQEPAKIEDKSKDSKDPWLNYLALSTVILAVCATLGAFKGSSYSTKAVMSQSQASDQWAFFQAKSIKGNLYDLQASQLELEMKAFPPTASTELNDSYRNRIDDNRKKVKKYEHEKEEIQAEAKRLEEIRDISQDHSKRFHMSVIFLQVAILLNSVAGLLKKQPVWWLGLMFGTYGLVHFANGFLVLF